MAAKTNTIAKRPARAAKPSETDGVYLLKLVLYTILGTQWLWFTTNSGTLVPLPVGFVLGIAFALHDHFQIDRKVEYGILIVAALVGYLAHVGLAIS